MERLAQAAPTLPMPLVALVALATLLATGWAMLQVRSRPGGFVIFASWLRYVMQAFHPITYKAIAGVSYNALSTIILFVVGLCTIRPGNLLLRPLLPIYLLILVAATSGVLNGEIDGLIKVAPKYGYLIVVTLCVYETMLRRPDGQFMRLLLLAFAAPMVLQLFSVVMGVAKATETEVGSESYIGGYNHEAAFSVILATGLMAACLTQGLSKYLKNGFIVACIIGLYLANYRTALLAVAPILVMYFGFSSLTMFPMRDRPIVVSVLLIFASLALGLVSLFFAERFSDLTYAFSGEVNLFKRPEAFTVDESRVLSGRPRIWSGYIFAWVDGNPLEKVLGFGPEAWSKRFLIYAHNTLVNTLFEHGVVGVVAILYLWFSMLSNALRVRHPQKGVLIGAHVSFLLLNMGTMPMWMIEGNILYGIICGYTLYLLRAPQAAPVAAPRGRARQKAWSPAPAAGRNSES